PGQGPQVRVLCQIPRRYHRLVRGARVEQLSRDRGVRLQFPPRETRLGAGDSPSDGGPDAEGTGDAQDAIALVGPERGCSAVKAIIE
ncbi:hypothetical protein chiPu_0030470, partial [Chiloscyllium punctatum]|nr:hypothetical protein [Chiloscyllium punctatum]